MCDQTFGCLHPQWTGAAGSRDFCVNIPDMLLNIAMFAQKCLMCDQKPGFLRKHSQRAIKHSIARLVAISRPAFTYRLFQWRVNGRITAFSEISSSNTLQSLRTVTLRRIVGKPEGGSPEAA
jgi:hypothetical protein